MVSISKTKLGYIILGTYVFLLILSNSHINDCREITARDYELEALKTATKLKQVRENPLKTMADESGADNN